VEKIAITHRPDFTVAEESGQFDRPNFLLHQSGVMAGPSEKVPAPAAATAQASAVHSSIPPRERQRGLEMNFAGAMPLR